jgi:hypothetical protein
VAGLWVMASCATPPKPAVVTDATEPPKVEVKSTESELSAAFEPEAPPPPAQTPTQVPPQVDIRASFREATDAVVRALAAKDITTAQSELAKVGAEAENLGLVERIKAAELAWKVAFAAPDVASARENAYAWMRTCGGDSVDACRNSAIVALASVARLDATKTKEIRDEVTQLQKTESCLRTSERAKRTDGCFVEAEQKARARKDEFLMARALYVRALAAPEPKQSAYLAAAESKCDALACVSVRRKSLSKLMAKAKAEKRTEDVARLALKDVHTLATTWSPAERIWARTLDTEAACAAYDANQGPGACRKLEKQLFGAWTFRDFSKDKPREGLSAQQVRTVNEHYAPLLQECLAAQAKRLKPPDSIRYELRWSVLNDGRVGEIHFSRRELDTSELFGCLKQQFESWRYPRYEGEWQHVEQSFTVSASERRSER